MDDYETTDLDGAALWEAHRDTGWEPTDGEWEDRLDDDRALDACEDLGNDPTCGFYDESWDGPSDPREPIIVYVPTLPLPDYDESDIPF
jgi:hypothetical protein